MNQTADNNAKKRVRNTTHVSMACTNCRRLKRKCDGVHPVCSPCSKVRSAECRYDAPVKKRGPPPGQMDSLRKQASEVDELRLENRKLKSTLEQLESELIVSQAKSCLPMYSTATYFTDVELRYVTAFFEVHGANGASPFSLIDEKHFMTVLPLGPRAYETESSATADTTALVQAPSVPEASVDPLAVRPVVFPVKAWVWKLQHCAVLAIGAQIMGDESDAAKYARLATVSAAELLEHASVEAVEGLAILALYFVGTRQHARASCYLYTATQMVSSCPAEELSTAVAFLTYLDSFPEWGQRPWQKIQDSMISHAAAVPSAPNMQTITKRADLRRQLCQLVAFAFSTSWTPQPSNALDVEMLEREAANGDDGVVRLWANGLLMVALVCGLGRFRRFQYSSAIRSDLHLLGMPGLNTEVANNVAVTATSLTDPRLARCARDFSAIAWSSEAKVVRTVMLAPFLYIAAYVQLHSKDATSLGQSLAMLNKMASIWELAKRPLAWIQELTQPNPTGTAQLPMTPPLQPSPHLSTLLLSAGNTRLAAIDHPVLRVTYPERNEATSNPNSSTE